MNCIFFDKTAFLLNSYFQDYTQSLKLRQTAIAKICVQIVKPTNHEMQFHHKASLQNWFKSFFITPSHRTEWALNSIHWPIPFTSPYLSSDTYTRKAKLEKRDCSTKLITTPSQPSYPLLTVYRVKWKWGLLLKYIKLTNKQWWNTALNNVAINPYNLWRVFCMLPCIPNAFDLTCGVTTLPGHPIFEVKLYLYDGLLLFHG